MTEQTFPDQLTLADALVEVNQGMAVAAANTSTDWWSRARRGVEWLAASGEPFTAYDLVVQCGIEEPDSPKSQWGAFFAAMKKAGLVEPAGFTNSKRPQTAGSAVRTWQGVQKTKGAA